MQRRMQRRIRLVVEERRMALALPPRRTAASFDPEATMEITPPAVGRATLPQV
jgi:hypothetical protein